MRVLDLFSGIGGFSLGLERAGMRTVAFCESDAFCRRILAKHWPHVRIYDDVRSLSAARLAADGIAVDVICGGPPCQPNSYASRGRGIGTTRDDWLWPEMLRLVSECRPAWVVCENVAYLDSVAIDQVADGLEALHYQVSPPLEIPACAVGLDHQRARLWLLGYADGEGQSVGTIDAKVAGLSGGRPDARNDRSADGLSGRVDRLRALGNSLVPQIPEAIGRAIMAVTPDVEPC